MDTSRTRRSALSTVLLTAMFVLVSATTTMAQSDEPMAAGSAATVVPPSEAPLGVPYGEWSNRWWQWLVSTPADVNPLMTGDCQSGQSGDVFYIPHTFPGSAVETSCTVSADQWVLASAGGILVDNSDGCCETEDALRELVAGEMSTYSEPRITIDGVEVPDIENYWAEGPLFQVEYIEDNVFEATPGVYDAVSAGWQVMIPPLEPGDHTIVVHDAIDFDDGAGPQVAELTAEIIVAGAE